MGLRIFSTLLATFLFLCSSSHGDNERLAAPPSPPPLSRAGLGALEHALKLVVAINELDWKTVEGSVSAKDPFLPLLKHDASTQKDWPGVGAYRGFEYDPERRTLRLRFSYGPTRTTPHEVWLYYSIAGDEFTFGGVSILGW